MRFVIRADASAQIGAGHVMRCCAIAEELIGRGEEVVFVGEIEGLPWVQARVNSWGFTEIYNRVGDFASNPNSDVLILDSYAIGPDDSFIEQRKWRKVVAIVDDVTPGYRADLYIHPGTESSWQPPAFAKDSLYISGIKYIPVRKSILTLGSADHFTRDGDPVILIVGGGSDPFDFCGAMGTVLHELSEKFTAIFFANDKFSAPADSRFTIVPIGTKVEDFLYGTNLVFTTAGTSSWEFLSCGLPIGLAQAVNNQSANYLYQVQANIALGIGLCNDSKTWQLNQEIIERIIRDPKLRINLAKNARSIVDGKGATRIVDAILLRTSR